jgi:hypothetical protein
VNIYSNLHLLPYTIHIRAVRIFTECTRVILSLSLTLIYILLYIALTLALSDPPVTHAHNHRHTFMHHSFQHFTFPFHFIRIPPNSEEFRAIISWQVAVQGLREPCVTVIDPLIALGCLTPQNPADQGRHSSVAVSFLPVALALGGTSPCLSVNL